MVSTHLKNISQIGNLSQIGVKIKNLWKHHHNFNAMFSFLRSSPLFLLRFVWKLWWVKNISYEKKRYESKCRGLPPPELWWKYGLKIFVDQKISMITPEKLTWPLEIGNPKRKLIFQPAFFRGYVKYFGGTVINYPCFGDICSRLQLQPPFFKPQGRDASQTSKPMDSHMVFNLPALSPFTADSNILPKGIFPRRNSGSLPTTVFEFFDQKKNVSQLPPKKQKSQCHRPAKKKKNNQKVKSTERFQKFPPGQGTCKWGRLFLLYQCCETWVVASITNEWSGWSGHWNLSFQLGAMAVFGTCMESITSCLA